MYFFSKNGIVLPMSEATIPLDNIAYQYGYGVYETLKLRKKVLFFSKQHIQRLMKSARIINLEHSFTLSKINNYLDEVIARNDVQNLNIKILLIGGETPADAIVYILPLNPLFPDKKLYVNGAIVDVVSYERLYPNAKTLNMLQSYLLYTEARRRGQYDVLYLDSKKNILEGSRTNFFAIKGKELVTAPKENVLAGVTRQTVIAIARKNGYSIVEEDIPLSSLNNFDGAFLTGTSAKIIPIKRISDNTFPEIVPNLKGLMLMYDDFLSTCGGVFDEAKY